MQNQKAPNTSFWNFLQVIIFTLLYFRASKNTYKPQKGFPAIEPHPGSCDRPRKPIVSQNLLVEPQKPHCEGVLKCGISFTFLKRSGGNTIGNAGHSVIAMTSKSHSTFKLGKTEGGGPTKHRFFLYQSLDKISLTSKGNENSLIFSNLSITQEAIQRLMRKRELDREVYIPL